MSWNNGYERKKFMARMKKQAEEYRAAGMTEEQVQKMFEYDLEAFRSDRNYVSHTQQYDDSSFDENDEESDNALMKQYIYELSYSDEDEYTILRAVLSIGLLRLKLR